MILVTGGTGLVGSHLLLKLAMQGKKIRAIYRKTSALSNVKRVFDYYSNQTEQCWSLIEWVDADLLDYETIETACEGVDTIYNAAGFVTFQPKDKDLMYQVNVEGVANLVNVALVAGVKTFYHVSSVAALGRTRTNEEITEETEWKESKQNSAYAISKFKGEMEVWRGMAEGLNVVIVNPSIIIGPGFWNQGSSKLVNYVWGRKKYYTLGVNGFVGVNDVVNALLYLKDEKDFNQRYIVSSENLTYKDLYQEIATQLNVKAPYKEASKTIRNIAWRLFYVYSLITRTKPLITKETARTAGNKTFYNSTKIQAIGFRFTSMHEVIKETVRFFKLDNSLNTKTGG